MWSDKSAQGGGFLDQTYAGNATQTTNKEPVRGNAIVPLMIGHLLEERPETLNLWGTPIKLIQLVAFVRTFERLTTKVSYDLVDETGSIMAFQWIDDNDTDLVTVPSDCYARVIGSLREQADSRHVFILNIKRLNSFADIFEHIAEVTLACIKGEELFTEPEPAKYGTSMETSESDNCHGMNKAQHLVFKIIRASNESSSGIERSEVKNKLPADVRDKVDEILEFLVCEGHIYTTCTDDHFKAT